MLSKPYPLHLFLRKALLSPIVKLSGARALVCRHFLRVLEGAAVGEIGRDAGCPKTVIADRRVDAGGKSTAPDHAPRICLSHRLFEEQGRGMPRRCAEEIALAVFRNAGGVDVGA